ncbi:MAG TPA: hypothetical protein VGC89_08375 [Pyrinomonadaceae bacterium]|jgi:hypothetical protein
MSKKLEQNTDAGANDGRRALKIAIIALAIIEALVLIPVVLRMIFH